MKKSTLLAVLVILSVVSLLCVCSQSSRRSSAPMPAGQSPSAGGTTTTGSSGSSAGSPGAAGAQPPQAALTGKRIILAPGHGWTYFDNLGRWTTQRGWTLGLLEDYLNNEICIHFLFPYLERAGALVFSTRERDMNTNEVVVTSSDLLHYTETGSWRDPVGAGGGFHGAGFRAANTSTIETARATFTPPIPEDGFYSVRTWWGAGPDRVHDARFVIRHSGGETEVRVDQKENGSRLWYLGTFHFERGMKGWVALSNESAERGSVIANAVRFGGGMGSIVRFGNTSGKARWQECSRYWLEYMGAPSSVYNASSSVDRWDDAYGQGHYVNWQGADAVLALHNNAAGGTGTVTFIHNRHPAPGSADFQEKVQSQLVNDIRALWKSNWSDRGKKTSNFILLRLSRNTPAVYIELAFYDRPDPDAAFLRDPRFRHDAARAIYKACARFLAPGTPILPLPPTGLAVRNAGGGSVRVSWEEPVDPLEPSAVPAGYKVYLSRNGCGFDNGTYTTARELTLHGLTPGETYYTKITALNAGGESFPTEVLAVRVASAGSTGILLVNGYDRLDEYVTVRRAENTFDYSRQHGDALTHAMAGACYFDGASNEAVENGTVKLADYRAVVWILGRESTRDETFSDREQALVRSYLQAGGRLFATGAEIAWDLGCKGNGTDRTFLKDVFRAEYVRDSSGKGDALPTARGIFHGLPALTFDPGGAYPVPYPDVIRPVGGSIPCLTYAGTSYPAGIQHDGGSHRLVFLGFPFEAIRDPDLRRAVMDRVIRFFF
jgi:N-acetylmuramoyl-L-alanine amidase